MRTTLNPKPIRSGWKPPARTVSLPKPLPHQLSVLLNPARHKVVICGRRWGKTALGLMSTIKGHGPERGALKGALDGGTIWWVGPTFPITSLIWRQLKRATQNAWSDKSEMDRRIDLPGGGSITVKSADNPDSLRGDGLDGLVIDEAAFVSEQAWKASLRPALADKQGWTIHITTPNGFNWVKTLFDRATRYDWARWQRPTSDNPLIPQEELDEARLDMGELLFAQEHMAQFTNIEGAEFSSLYFPDDMWFDSWPDKDAFQYRIQTCDPSLGKTDKSDYQAHVIMALDRQGTMWVEADLRRRDRVQIAGDMFDIAGWFHPQAIGIESNMWQVLLADQLYEISKAAGMSLPIWPMNNWENKIVRIRATLTPYLSRGEFRFRDTPGTRLLVEQLRSFPACTHDDGPDALELAVRLMRDIYQRGAVSSPDDVDGASVSCGVLL